MTNSNIILSVSNLSKVYMQYHKPSDLLWRAVFPGTMKSTQGYWALKKVSFDVKEGEIVGLIGRNGAGKTTLLRIIAGIVTPTEGEVCRRGKMAALLELGGGFNHDFTGKDNIKTAGMILGFSSREIDLLTNSIIDFADIGDHINQPIKTYSSGMIARLAMAVSIHMFSELLLIDEILSVGDVFFQKKCFKRLQSLINEGRTIILCSHDLGAIRRYCTRVIYLNEGKLAADGDVVDVLTIYLQSNNHNSLEEQLADNEADASSPEPGPAVAYKANSKVMNGTLVDTSLKLAPEWQPDHNFNSTLLNPRGLALIEGGNLLVADPAKHALIEVTHTAKIVGKWGKTGFDSGEFYDPITLDVLPDGGVAIADYTTGRISIIQKDRTVEIPFGGQPICDQPIMLRFSPEGSAWVSCWEDSSLRVYRENEGIHRVLQSEKVERYITDVLFINDKAYITDYRNHEILVYQSEKLDYIKTISLAKYPDARGPHGIVILGDYLVVSCHDSHSLFLMEYEKETPNVMVFDLEKYLINNPCYIVINNDRMYISASILGGVTAFDISGWLV